MFNSEALQSQELLLNSTVTCINIHTPVHLVVHLVEFNDLQKSSILPRSLRSTVNSRFSFIQILHY